MKPKDMPDNTCICCGRVIPEGRHVCLRCGDYDDMQTTREPEITGRRYFKITDECGWIYYIDTNRRDLSAEEIELLVPHVRSAKELTRSQFDEGRRKRG